MSDYSSGDFPVQIIAILASLFLLFLQIAFFVDSRNRRNLDLYSVYDGVGAYLIALAILTIFMELPKKLNAKKIQSPVARIFPQYKDQLTRGVWYFYQSVFMFSYLASFLNNRNHRAFAICYLIAGVLWVVAGLLSIILKAFKKN